MLGTHAVASLTRPMSVTTRASELRPRDVPRNSDSSFRDLVAALQLQGVARILDVGAGGFLGETTTIHLLDLFPDAQITAVELDAERADALKEKCGDRM